jgi:hypothetical protein
LHALAQRAEAWESEARVMGSKSTLLGALVAAPRGKVGDYMVYPSAD